MWRRNQSLYLLVLYFVGSKTVAVTDEPSGRQTQCSHPIGDYEIFKKVAELDVKQSQFEEVIKAQKLMLDSQQNLITRLQQQLTGLEAKASRNYNYKDEIAQATCTSIHPGGKYVYAVRRQCSAQAASCAELCKSLGMTCFNAVQLLNAINLEDSATGSIGIRTFKYNWCDGNFCGPNFCCCTEN